MSKKLNTLLTAMLVFSMVTPTALAETNTPPDATQSAEDNVLLSTTSDETTTTQVTPVVGEVEDVTTTSVETDKTSSTEEITTSSTTEDVTPKEEPKVEEPKAEEPKAEETSVEEPKKEVSTDGLPSKSVDGLPDTIFDAEQTYYDAKDVTVDKTKAPYKDGVYLELRYSNLTDGTAHIPTFKVALIDEKGKGLGEVVANRANYNKDLKAYQLVIPHSKALNYGDKIGIYAYDFDGSVKSINLKRSLPLKEEGEGEDIEFTYVEETVKFDNQFYYFYKMGHFLVENNKDIEKHYTFSAFNPIEGWVETNENLIAFNFVTSTGTPIKDTKLTLKEPNSGNKVEVKTDAYGVAYVAVSKFKGKVVSIESSQYELTSGMSTIGINVRDNADRTTVKKVTLQQKTEKEGLNEGVANVGITVKGDTTLTNEWLNTTLTFKSAKDTLNFDIGIEDIAKGLTVKLPQGSYTVTAKSAYGTVKLGSSNLTIGDKAQNVSLEISPKYLLEISKDGKAYDYKFLNVVALTDKKFSGTNTIAYGVVPNQSFMVEDQADGKVYTVFINPDYTVTKLVLGVGVVWGGEVSTPHTGDNIIFLVALFLLSLIIAGVGFYFHKTGKRVKNLAVTTGLIGLLILSTMPVNVAQASMFSIELSHDGTTSGSGASGSYTQMSSGTIQVSADASMLMTTYVPMGTIIANATKGDFNGELGDYLFSDLHLSTAMFFPTNKSQYDRAQNGSFMTYDYERGSLIPIWGSKNAVVGNVPKDILNSNQQVLGITNSSFASRIMSYPYQKYKNDYDNLVNIVTADLGGSSSTRQLWTGKDILGRSSSSTKQIGDSLDILKMDNFIKSRTRKYFPTYDIAEGKPVDVIIESYLGALKGVTKDSILTELKEDTKIDYKSEGQIKDGELAISQKYASFLLMFQNVHGVYINGQSQTHMAYMPVEAIGEWYNDAMRKARSDYRALNILPYETGKMLYDAKAYAARGTNNPAYYTTAPTKTFVGNTEGTTGKSLVPTTLNVPKRPTNTASSVNANPFSGWGFINYTSLGVGYSCIMCGPSDENPGIYSWLKLHVTNEDGSEETKTIPWNKVVNKGGKVGNFLASNTYTENKTYYDFDGAYVHEGIRYTAQDNEENKNAKVTIKDKTGGLSLIKPYSNTLDTSGKYDVLFDGLYFLHKNEKPINDIKVDATVPVTLDAGHIPYLTTINAALKSDPDFVNALGGELSALAEGATTSVKPIANSGFTYPTKAYDSSVGYIMGTHYSQADLTLELYVDASCIDPVKCGKAPTPTTDGTGVHTVPEWRLSEYYADSTPGSQSDSIVNFVTPGSTWWSPAVTNSGSTKFNLSTSDLSGVPWMESKAKMFNGDTPYRNVSAYGNNFRFQVGGDLLAIKDNSTVTNSKLATWKNDYSILNKKVGASVKGAVEPNGKNSITKKHTVKYNVRSPYSNYTYSEDRLRCDAYSCWTYRWSGAASMNYTFDSTNHITVVFKRYNPKDNTNLSNFAKKSDKTANGFYWESYQDTQTLKVNPEVSMVYDDNSGNVTVVQSAADRMREIKPVHYNSVEFHNVNVVPKVDGMAVATDAQAKVLGNSKGKGLDVIYKGASTSASYEVKGEIKLRTYALDIGSTALKNTWGNSGYSTEKVRDEFLTRHATKEADGTWTIKPTAKGNYVIANKDYGGVSEIKNVKQKDYKVLEHTLVVRGGKILSVNGQKNLASIDPLLKDAVERMNISTNRGANVFNQFEYDKGTNLGEADVANLLNITRGVNEHSVGQPWYFEDTTTLVVREYITTYDLPSHVYVDKIPQEIPGLQTPMNKEQFFKQGETGFGKYRIQLLDSWMEYDSSKPTPFGGVQTRLYVVPNVSITDTAQF